MFRCSGSADLLSGPVAPDPLTPKAVLGARVQARRLAAGKTQEWLAEALDRHVTYVSRIENGKFDPRLTEITKVAFVLGVDVKTLTAGLLPSEPQGRMSAIKSRVRPAEPDS